MRATVSRRISARAIGALCALALVASLGAPASAAKKKPAGKPVATKLFMHGTLPAGEVESRADGAYLPMNPTEPSDSQPKSYQITNYGGGPNTTCAGNMYFPVWVGPVAGKIVGDLKLTFHAISSGGTVEVRVWPDVNSLLCDSATGSMDYVEPVTSATASLPPGPGAVEVVLPNQAFTAQALMMVQITPVTVPPFFSRVLYDTPTYASVLEFSCIPASGSACTSQ